MFRYLLCVVALVVAMGFAADAKAHGGCAVANGVVVNSFGVQQFVPAGVVVQSFAVHPFAVQAFAAPVVVQQRAVVRQRVLRAPRQRSLSIQRSVIR